MRTPDYWEPSDNVEDRRRTPNPEHQQLIRERRLGSIYDQADDADTRQGIRLDDGNGGVYDPNAPIQTLVGGVPVSDPFAGTTSPLKFLERLGPMATPELGMMILQDPQRAIEMLAGRGIPLMHSDFGGGGTQFPPSPSYPPPQEPVKGPGGSTVPSEAPGNRPRLDLLWDYLFGEEAPPPAAPTTREPLPPPVQDRPPVAPPMAGSPPPNAPQPAPVAPPPAPAGTPTPPPGTEASGGWWDPIDKGVSSILRQFIPGANTLDPNRPIAPTMSGQSSPSTSPPPYGGMDPQDYNTPAPSPFDPALPEPIASSTTLDEGSGSPLDITSAAQNGSAAKPAANGIAAMLSGLKPVETKANVPGTPPPPHPTAGNSTNLADLIAMMTGGQKAASNPLDGLGLLLARGKL